MYHRCRTFIEATQKCGLVEYGMGDIVDEAKVEVNQLDPYLP